jgi:hypothetical protein
MSCLKDMSRLISWSLQLCSSRWFFAIEYLLSKIFGHKSSITNSGNHSTHLYMEFDHWRITSSKKKRPFILKVCSLVWYDGTSGICFQYVEFDWCRCYYHVSNCIYYTIHYDRNFLYYFKVRFRNCSIFISFKSSNDRIFFCLDIIMWFVGTLHLFAASERLGPKLMMIFNTVCSFVFFLQLSVSCFCLHRWKISSFLSVLFSFSCAPIRSHHGHWLILRHKWTGSIVMMDNCLMLQWLNMEIIHGHGNYLEI